MKTNRLIKFNIFLLAFIFLFGIGFVFCGEQKTDTVVYAQEDLQIENDGMIISTELWVALYNVYCDTYNQKPTNDVLTLDMFKNFPISVLNLSTNLQGQSYGIKSISGLAEFDLTSFTSVNLSGNQISSVGEELKNLTNLQKLDLADNNLGTFNTNMLANGCIASITEINLSGNNLTECDLTGLVGTNIDLSNNKLTQDKLTLPQDTTNLINLNKNYIAEPNTTLTNVAYGYQGAKDQDKFVENTDILFLANQNIEFTKIEIYENDTLYDTLTDNEKITLPVGNYTLKFLNASDIEVEDSISFKVVWPKVTAKLFVGEKEIEFTSVLTEDTVIKFYGLDGAEIFVSNQSSEYQTKTEYLINKNGVVILKAYQTKDGYSSDIETFYFKVQKQNITDWVIVGVGIIGMILLYFVFKFITNKIINGTGKSNMKGKLD